MKRKATIKKCKPSEKKPGRKYPENEQEYCLWSEKDPDDLLMAGPKKAVEKHEQEVQYFKNASIIVNGQVFRRAALQLFIPPPRPNVPHVRTAATKQEVEKWASQVYKFMHQLEDQAEKSTETIHDAGAIVGEKAKGYGKLLGQDNRFEQMAVLSEAYGQEGLKMVEASNVLAEAVRERFRWAAIVDDYLSKLLNAGLSEDEPSVVYLMEAAAALNYQPKVTV